MKNSRWYQDDAGQWWFTLKNGTRTRGDEYACLFCGSSFFKQRSGVSKARQKPLYCSRICSNQAFKPNRHRHGAAAPQWRGGKGINRRTGYVEIYDPVTKRRKLEHRLVMENHIGRPLLPWETVHHKNGNKTDNDIKNLELWTSRHPKGQRVEDLVIFAREILALYT